MKKIVVFFAFAIILAMSVAQSSNHPHKRHKRHKATTPQHLSTSALITRLKADYSGKIARIKDDGTTLHILVNPEQTTSTALGCLAIAGGVCSWVRLNFPTPRTVRVYAGPVCKARARWSNGKPSLNAENYEHNPFD
jgi:hypothetical protein